MASPSILPYVPEADPFSLQLGNYITVVEITVSHNMKLAVRIPVDHPLTYLPGLLLRLVVVDIG